MTTRRQGKLRDPLALKASEIRLGMDVICDEQQWSVWSPAPEVGTFWLTRWVDKNGKQANETRLAKVSELSRVRRLPAQNGA